jgi:hypothetical protein
MAAGCVVFSQYNISYPIDFWSEVLNQFSFLWAKFCIVVKFLENQWGKNEN